MIRACSTADSNVMDHDSNPVSVSSLLRPRDANCNDFCLWSSAPPSEENSMNEYFTQPSSIYDPEKNNLTEVLKNLLLIVEDVSDSYPEVNEISAILEEIEQLIKVSCHL